MLIFNVTVTQGTLSEFLFYINVFYIFRVSLFPSYKDAGNLSYLHSAYTGFVSFMNLVYTYNQCYYNGLDMSGYCWIHFLMIFYLWGITGLFIWLCKRFSWLSNRITNLKKHDSNSGHHHPPLLHKRKHHCYILGHVCKAPLSRTKRQV